MIRVSSPCCFTVRVQRTETGSGRQAEPEAAAASFLPVFTSRNMNMHEAEGQGQESGVRHDVQICLSKYLRQVRLESAAEDGDNYVNPRKGERLSLRYLEGEKNVL